ncbi:MAG: hypothetical protein ACLURP_13600 [Ruminococcus sp.]
MEKEIYFSKNTELYGDFAGLGIFIPMFSPTGLLGIAAGRSCALSSRKRK